MLSPAQLDQILALQLLVAWAGEADTEPARQGWWRTAMLDEYGGGDFLAQLTPRTWRWGVLQTAYTAARRVDDRARARAADPDAVITLFHLGPAPDADAVGTAADIDEAIADRLADLVRENTTPEQALPTLAAIAEPWQPERFAALVQQLTQKTAPRFNDSPLGRRLAGAPPAPLERAHALCAALLPLSSPYPTPHYLVKT